MQAAVKNDHTIVVGGGAIGVCIAYFLARRGCRVTLIERDGIAAAASSGNAGLISLGHLPLPRPGLLTTSLRWMLDRTSPLYVPPRPDLPLLAWLIRFARACSARQLRTSMEVIAAISRSTIELFDHFANDLKIDFQYRPTGYMDVFRSQDAWNHARRDAEYIRSFGFPEKEIGPDEVYRREPALLDGVVGAIAHEGSAFAEPAEFVRGVADAARALGAVIMTDSEVQSIRTANGAVSGVQTSTESFGCDRLVLAAGAWTTSLAKLAGVRVPMQPAKGYHVNITTPTESLRSACMLGDTYVICTPINGYLRLAGTLELSGLNHNIRQERVDMLIRQAAAYLPGIAEAPVISQWCGLRPCTADGLPALGWAPRVRNLYVATGHAMMGFWTSPMTGRVVSEHILDDSPSIDIHAMRLERF